MIHACIAHGVSCARWLLERPLNGERVTTCQVADEYGITVNGAKAMLGRMS